MKRVLNLRCARSKNRMVGTTIRRLQYATSTLVSFLYNASVHVGLVWQGAHFLCVVIKKSPSTPFTDSPPSSPTRQKQNDKLEKSRLGELGRLFPSRSFGSIQCTCRLPEPRSYQRRTRCCPFTSPKWVQWIAKKRRRKNGSSILWSLSRH